MEPLSKEFFNHEMLSKEWGDIAFAVQKLSDRLYERGFRLEGATFSGRLCPSVIIATVSGDVRLVNVEMTELQYKRWWAL